MGDYAHNGIGIEFKCKKVGNPLNTKRVTHVITRVVDWNTSDPVNVSKKRILSQLTTHNYVLLRRAKSLIKNSAKKPVAKYGTLLYNETFEDFVYFEKEIDFYRFTNKADQYKAKKHGNSIWIFKKGNPIFTDSSTKRTNTKRRKVAEKFFVSVTQEKKGSKIQMAFAVPEIGKGAEHFHIPSDGLKPLWVEEQLYVDIHATVASAEIKDFIRDLFQDWKQSRSLGESKQSS